MQEPDKVQWVDESTGLLCLILRHTRLGHLCGYVGVNRTHPLYQTSAGACVLDKPCLDYCEHRLDFDVHGGITFSGGEEHLGAPLIAPIWEDGIFFYGFDCAHYTDVSPGILMFGFSETYKTIEYVTEQ